MSSRNLFVDKKKEDHGEAEYLVQSVMLSIEEAAHLNVLRADQKQGIR